MKIFFILKNSPLYDKEIDFLNKKQITDILNIFIKITFFFLLLSINSANLFTPKNYVEIDNKINENYMKKI